METQNTSVYEDNSSKIFNSVRITVSDDILKKIAIIASLEGIDGKKNEIIQKVIEIAVNHYFKDIAIKELQKM